MMRNAAMEFLEKLFGTTSAAVAIIDAAGEINWINRAFENHFGYDPAHLLKSVDWPFLASDHQEQLLAWMERAIAGNPPEFFDAPVICSNNAVKTIRWNALPIPDEKALHGPMFAIMGTETGVPNRDRSQEREGQLFYGEGGNLQGVEGVFMDVSQLRQTERELRESEERLRGIMANLPGVIYQFYAKDDGEWGVSYANRRMRDFFGLQTDTTTLFADFIAHVHEEDRERFVAAIQQAVQTCMPWEFQGRFIKPAGETIWFQGVSTPTRYEDRVVFEGILLDITEGKKAEERFRLSEEKFTKVFMMSPDMVAITRIDDGLIADVNMGFEDITGWTRSEVIGRTSSDLDFWVHPEDRALMVEDLRAGRDVVHREIPFRHKNGSLHTGIYSARLIHMDGELFLIFVMQDITDLKQAQELSRQSKEKFTKVFMTAPDCIAIGRLADGMILDVNMGFEEVTGWTRDEVVGRPSGDIGFWVHPDDRDFMAQELVAGRDVLNHEFQFRRKDNAVRTGIYSARYIEIEGNACLMFILNDVTGRKLTEKKIAETEALYRTLVESLPDTVMVLDLKGRILFLSNNAVRLYGIDRPDALIGHPFEELFAPDSVAEVELFFQELVADGQTRLIENVRLTRRGNPWIAEVWASAIRNEAGQMSGFIWVTRDATDQKRLEEERRKLEQQLFQSQKLDAIGKLASGVAHDFNNILMGIQGNVSLMLLEQRPEHPHYERLNMIEEHIKRGANLTRQLLGFAREGKYEVKILSINELILKSARFFMETRKEIETDYTLAQDVYPIEADAGQLEQVLVNIFINAAHAMPGGGRLYIKTSNTTLEEADARSFEARPGDYAKICISDTGIGMDAETLGKIFEPFFTTKAKQGGSGLGLASAYGIIRNHGGVIKAYSEPGRGSTFSIYLPSSAKRAEAVEQAPAKSLFSGSGCILLVDDEPMILSSASEMLKRLGYTVYPVASGQEAVAAFLEKKDRIDLIILDMILPGMSGAQVLKIIKDIDPGVKVILSSGYSLQGDVQKVMEIGCRGFIQKPYNLRELSQIVHEVLFTSAS